MRVFAFAVTLPLLAGCGAIDWDHLTSFGTSPKPEAAPQANVAPPPQTRTAAAAPPSQAAAPDPFCLAVARQDATTQGFDQATAGRVAIRSYQQCVGLFGPSAPR